MPSVAPHGAARRPVFNGEVLPRKGQTRPSRHRVAVMRVAHDTAPGRRTLPSVRRAGRRRDDRRSTPRAPREPEWIATPTPARWPLALPISDPLPWSFRCLPAGADSRLASMESTVRPLDPSGRHVATLKAPTTPETLLRHALGIVVCMTDKDERSLAVLVSGAGGSSFRSARRCPQYRAIGEQEPTSWLRTYLSRQADIDEEARRVARERGRRVVQLIEHDDQEDTMPATLSRHRALQPLSLRRHAHSAPQHGPSLLGIREVSATNLTTVARGTRITSRADRSELPRNRRPHCPCAS